MVLITTAQQLLEEICTVLNANISQVQSKKRTDKLVKVRHLYCYVGKTYYKFSLVNLGASIGGRDHTTVINGCNRIKEQLQTNDEVTVKGMDLLKSRFELSNTTADSFYQLEKEYDSLMGDYAKLKISHKKITHELIALKNENQKLLNKLKTHAPKNIFGELIK
jgi:uncharacterized phage infection (PIP) family protein YhgE